MFPFILAAVAGGVLVKNMTGYPAEINNLRRQIPKGERAEFMRDYKSLPKDAKTQFKQYLREANLVEAGKLIGRDLSGFSINVKEKANKSVEPPIQNQAPAESTNNGFAERVKNILDSYPLDIDPQLTADAAKRYEEISGFNQMNILDKTRKMLDVSQ